MDRKPDGGKAAGDDKAATLRNFRKIASNASKYSTRSFEKVQQRIGKNDKTEDAYFHYNVDNFERQQASAAKMQK